MTQVDPADVAALSAARQRVLDRIADAAGRAGRDPAGVTLVAVSKTVPAERLVAAVEAGLTILAEPRPAAAEPLGQLSKRPEGGAGLLGSLDQAPDRHQPANVEP